MKKFNFIAGCFIVAVILIIGYDMVKSSPDKIVLQPGWQKMQQVTGEIPKGSIVITSTKSALSLPGSKETHVSCYPIEGAIIFNEKAYCTTKGPVWIYCPDEYEFMLEMENLLLQGDEKLAELREEKSCRVKNLIFIGHP